MCGIVGIIGEDLHGLNLEKSVEALNHRGPDMGDSFTETHAGKMVFFGHRRLSIIDRSEAGRQPMHADGTSMVYNGEVYNFAELKRAHLSGSQFVSNTDTEVVLRLYVKTGDGFVKHLRGDFALAILNRDKDEVILARDPIGVKPMYVYRSNGIFAFASEIKAFRAAGLPLTFDSEAVSDYLVFKYNPLQQTLFREVEKLKPGTILRYDLSTGAESSTTFWRLDDHTRVYRGGLKNAAAELREHLDAAIHLRLVGDAPIANFLSGGLDSSIIAHAIKDGGHVHYCAVKSQADIQKEGTTSDGYYAKRLAAEWNLDLHTIPIGLESLTDEELSRAVMASDELIADGSIIPAMLMAREAAKNHRVVLSGMGADELFFGYNGHYLTRLNSMVGRIPGFRQAMPRVLSVVSGNRGPFKAYRRYVQKWGNNAGKPFEVGRFSVVGDVDSALRIQNRPKDPAEIFAPYFDSTVDDEDFDRLFRFEMDNFLVKNLHYLDGSSMAYGMESRVPFLDTEVVSFAAGLPAEFKIDARFNAKKILKLAYEDVLPSYVIRRRKAGFGMPLRSILGERETLKRMMPYPFIEGSGLFDMDEVIKLENDHISGRQDHSALLYALICLGRWHKIFFES